ncbi:MAG: hypothetical protein IH927_08205 [Proteobacteria bacterium]|nr:hypothetical protein [Pseudomonadota bacterium]
MADQNDTRTLGNMGVVRYVNQKTVEEVLLQAVFQAPVFGTRWRWNGQNFTEIL